MLIDFGVVVERTKDEIFKLQEKWLKRQAAAYKGKVTKLAVESANAQEIIKSFVDARIVGISKDTVELLFV
jgi:hypothetical protein